MFGVRFWNVIDCPVAVITLFMLRMWGKYNDYSFYIRISQLIMIFFCVCDIVDVDSY